jgi:hypothetical protein
MGTGLIPPLFLGASSKKNVRPLARRLRATLHRHLSLEIRCPPLIPTCTYITYTYVFWWRSKTMLLRYTGSLHRRCQFTPITTIRTDYRRQRRMCFLKCHDDWCRIFNGRQLKEAWSSHIVPPSCENKFLPWLYPERSGLIYQLVVWVVLAGRSGSQQLFSVLQNLQPVLARTVHHSVAVLTGNHLKSKSPMPILFLRMSLGYITKVLYNSTRDDYGHS